MIRKVLHCGVIASQGRSPLPFLFMIYRIISGEKTQNKNRGLTCLSSLWYTVLYQEKKHKIKNRGLTCLFSLYDVPYHLSGEKHKIKTEASPASRKKKKKSETEAFRLHYQQRKKTAYGLSRSYLVIDHCVRRTVLLNCYQTVTDRIWSNALRRNIIRKKIHKSLLIHIDCL